MFPRYGNTRGMDHMRLHPARPQPARQPEAVSTSFEGQCNPRDLAASPDRLVAPAMQQAKQPFCTRLQFLARLALTAPRPGAREALAHRRAMPLRSWRPRSSSAKLSATMRAVTSLSTAELGAARPCSRAARFRKPLLTIWNLSVK